MAGDKAKTVQKHRNITLFLRGFAEKELFSGKDSTFACGNKLFSETQITLWVVPSFNNVLRTHTYTFNYRFGTNMAPD